VRVAVNCAIATRGVSGSARGLEHLLGALSRMEEVCVDQLWPRIQMRRSHVWNAGAQAGWDLRLAAGEATHADVLVSPCNVGLARSGQAHVVVLHDTMVLDLPHLFDRGYAAYAHALFGISVCHADVVLVPSGFTERCVRRRWPSCPPTIVARWPLKVQPVRDTATVEIGHVVMVGATEPHKHHALGLKAVRMARDITGADLRLTLIGPAGRAENTVEAARRRVDPRSAWTSRLSGLSDDELDAWYGRAWVLLQPSSAEGYGLPVGEAASRGIPAVHSGMGALNEIAPGGVRDADDAASYAIEVSSLLDSTRYVEAAQAAIAAAGQLSDVHFTAAVKTALGVAMSPGR